MKGKLLYGDGVMGKVLSRFLEGIEFILFKSQRGCGGPLRTLVETVEFSRAESSFCIHAMFITMLGVHYVSMGVNDRKT